MKLALQGGGAHGAFTWGVLDRLLQEPRLEIEAISGTSAGAMNAVVLAAGHAKGGREGAREALASFWKTVSRDGRMSPLQRGPMDRMLGNWSLEANPVFMAMNFASRFFSPYDLNPLNLNPLRELLERAVDFEAIRDPKAIRIFLSATNVHTGKVRVFSNREITADVVMASACLPLLFRAVEIEGTPYWDGGYVSNPPLFPFFKEGADGDVVVVQTSPLLREATPQSARDIANRMDEITFNASLAAEYRAIDSARRKKTPRWLRRLTGKRDPEVRLHRIAAGAPLAEFTSSSKFAVEWPFLLQLHEIGRAAADEFIERRLSAIGRRSTLELIDEAA